MQKMEPIARTTPLPMSKLPTFHPLSRSLAVRTLLPALALGGVAIAATPGTRNEKPVVMENYVVDATKTHTLFMGADISVNLDKDLYVVRDVVGSSWVIDINGKDKVVSTREAPLNLKITPNLKLTEVSATISGFKREAAYSFDNDPSVIITKGLTKAGSTNAMLLGVAMDARNLADTVSNRGLGPAALFAQSDNQFGDRALMFTAQTTPAITHPPKAMPGLAGVPVNKLVPSTFPDMWDSRGNPLLAIKLANDTERAAESQTANGDEAAGRLTTQGLDAMDVEFDIKSDRPLYNPYVVTITKFHATGSKPGTVQNLVYARALDPIDSHYTHVHFSEDGFPFNYELIDFQLHVYNRGVEIATNLSSKRVELTRDEAFEYVKMEYIGAHRSDTLPAVPAMGKLPAELPNRLATGKYGETFFVKVSKGGLAEEPFADVTCSKKIEDPFLQAVVRSLRFKPALAHGEPVEGVAAVNLSKLQI
jgi:hypothetical protein